MAPSIEQFFLVTTFIICKLWFELFESADKILVCFRVIQMKANEQNVPVVMFIMPHRVVCG